MSIADCNVAIDSFDRLSQKQRSQLSRVLYSHATMALTSIIQIKQTLQRSIMEIHAIRVRHLELKLPKRVIAPRKLHNRTIANYHVVAPQVARVRSEFWQDLRRCNRMWNIPRRIEQYALDTCLKLGGVSAPAADDDARGKDQGIVAKEL